MLGIGLGLVVLSPLAETYSRTVHPGILGRVFVATLSSVGIVYALFGVVHVGWKRLFRSDRLPFGIAVLTAGIAIGAVIGTELFTQRAGSNDGFRETVEYVLFQPPLVISYCVAWLYPSIAPTRGSTTLRRRLLVIAGPAVFLLTPLAVVLTDGTASEHGIQLVSMIWALASGGVLAFTGLYVLLAYAVQKSFAAE